MAVAVVIYQISFLPFTIRQQYKNAILIPVKTIYNQNIYNPEKYRVEFNVKNNLFFMGFTTNKGHVIPLEISAQATIHLNRTCTGEYIEVDSPKFIFLL